MRMIASNWRGLGSHYEHRVGCDDLVEAYRRIAMHDFARADALDEEAQQVAENYCPDSASGNLIHLHPPGEPCLHMNREAQNIIHHMLTTGEPVGRWAAARAARANPYSAMTVFQVMRCLVPAGERLRGGE